MNDLADDQIKLVAYAIVFTKPEHEQVMPGGEGSIVVTDNLTDEQFVSMMIARYMQPKDGKPSRYAEVIKSKSDLKYLRVHFAVPRRWPKEPLEAGRRQSDALDRLRDRLVPREGGR